MQDRIRSLQEELARAEVTGEAGAGLIRVVMNGRHEAIRVTIDPELLREAPVVLQELLAAAINDAVGRIERNQQQKLAELTAGLSLPPGFRFPQL
jgi:DNA-binding YbaB/EbfC family protein